MKRYPTPWQRKTLWAAISAICVVVLGGIVGYAIWYSALAVSFFQPILVPVAIAVILGYLLDPLITRMCARGIGRTTAILVVFAVAFLALGGLIAWLVPTISMQSAAFAKELPGYSQRARERAVDLIYRYGKTFGLTGTTQSKASSPTGSVLNWLLASPSPSPGTKRSPSPTATPSTDVSPAASPTQREAPAAVKLTSTDRARIQEWVQNQLPNVERQFPNLAEKAWAIITKSIGGFFGFTGFLLSLFMVPIYLFFLLKERPAIERRWKEYLPLRNSPLKDEVAAVLTQINNYVIAYFRGQLLVCLVDGVLIGVALLIFGLNFAPLIGLLVVVLTMMPYIGIILCWIPAVLIALAQYGDFWHPFWVTMIFFAVQQAEGTFYAPRIVGKSVGLHPMTVIVSIFLWGLLIGGLLGPILAIPLTATIKVLLARYVWGRRLREEVEETTTAVPVVREAEVESAV